MSEGPRTRSLRGVLRRWLLLYGVCVFGIFAVLFPLIALQIEDSIFSKQVVQEQKRLDESGGPPRAPFVEWAPGSPLSPSLADRLLELPEGVHELDDIELPEFREGFVSIRGEGADRRALLLDVSEIEVLTSIRHPFFLGLLLAGGLLAAIGVLGGVWTARLALRSLTRFEQLPLASSTEFELEEVEQVASQLQARLKRWEEAAEEEARFTREASHELRNPLAVIGGAADLLERTAEDPQRVRVVASRIREATSALSELVEVFLWLGTPRSSSSPGDGLATALVSPAQWFRERAVAADSLEIIAEEEFEAPPLLLSIVLRNFWENAERHGVPESARVTIDAHKVVIENEVEPGESTSGTGFGLSIVERIADRMGWSWSATQTGALFRAEIRFR